MIFLKRSFGYAITQLQVWEFIETVSRKQRFTSAASIFRNILEAFSLYLLGACFRAHSYLLLICFIMFIECILIIMHIVLTYHFSSTFSLHFCLHLIASIPLSCVSLALVLFLSFCHVFHLLTFISLLILLSL